MKDFPTKLIHLSASLLILLCCVSCSPKALTLKEQGDQLVQKIEQFQTSNGRLPNSLAEIGETESEEGPLFYQTTEDGSYQVWYGGSLGESVVWDSKKKSWAEPGG